MNLQEIERESQAYERLLKRITITDYRRNKKLELVKR